MQLPKHVIVREVGPRDGFQPEKEWIPTEAKIEIVNMISRCGVPEIEVTSFTHPKWIPQLRDAEEVMAGIERRPGTEFVALAPNLVGAKRALAAKVDGIDLVVSASETHNKKNVNMSISESLTSFRQVLALANDTKVPVVGGIATVFGCPMEGDIPVERVIWVADELLKMGCCGISLGDSTGMANPRQMREFLSEFRDRFPDVRLILHLHDTRGMGLANTLVGLEMGVLEHDAALGGMGGCPYAPGATGNISTEDMVHMFEEMGIETGINLDGLIAAGKRLREITGRDLYSTVVQAGKVKDLHSREWESDTKH